MFVAACWFISSTGLFFLIRVVACRERSLQPCFVLQWHAVACPEWPRSSKELFFNGVLLRVVKLLRERFLFFNCMLLHVESGHFEHGVVLRRRVCACQVPLHVESGNFEHGAFPQRHAIACQDGHFGHAVFFQLLAHAISRTRLTTKGILILEHLQKCTLARLHEVQLSETCR